MTPKNIVPIGINIDISALVKYLRQHPSAVSELVVTEEAQQRWQQQHLQQCSFILIFAEIVLTRRQFDATIINPATRYVTIVIIKLIKLT